MTHNMQRQDITIVRASHDDPFFILRRATPQDDTLTWEARGMLVYLLSKPDDWKLKPRDLQQKCGRDKVYSILRELVDARYIDREKIVDDKARIIKWIYRIYEAPLPGNPEVGNDDPLPGNPDEAPLPRNPEMDNLGDSPLGEPISAVDGLANPHVRADIDSIIPLQESWKPLPTNLGSQNGVLEMKESSVMEIGLGDGGVGEGEGKKPTTKSESGSKPTQRNNSSPQGKLESLQSELGKPNGSESTTPPSPQSPAPPKAKRAKAPPKLHSRFAGTLYYAVNEAKEVFRADPYTEEEAEAKAPGLVPYGYVMVKGSLLNADLKYAREGRFKTVNNEPESLKGIDPAWQAFEIYSPLKGDGARITKIIKQLAKRENMLLSDLKASKEIAEKIRQVYKMCEDKGIDPPTGEGSFIRQWNMRHHPPTTKPKADPSYRLVMVPLPDNRSAIGAGDAETQDEASLAPRF